MILTNATFLVRRVRFDLHIGFRQPSEYFGHFGFRAVERADLDASRVHLLGFSQGGYFAGWLALRRPDRFEAFLLTCEADARGRLGMEQRDYPQADYLRRALATAQTVSAKQFSDSGLTGKDLGDAINAERSRVLETLRPS